MKISCNQSTFYRFFTGNLSVTNCCTHSPEAHRFVCFHAVHLFAGFGFSTAFTASNILISERTLHCCCNSCFAAVDRQQATPPTEKSLFIQPSAHYSWRWKNGTVGSSEGCSAEDKPRVAHVKLSSHYRVHLGTTRLKPQTWPEGLGINFAHPAQRGNSLVSIIERIELESCPEKFFQLRL